MKKDLIANIIFNNIKRRNLNCPDCNKHYVDGQEIVFTDDESER